MKISQLLSSLIPNPQSPIPDITEVSGYLREMVLAVGIASFFSFWGDRHLKSLLKQNSLQQFGMVAILNQYCQAI